MKLAIIGANGQLGSDLVRAFGSEHYVVPLTHTDIDVTDLRSSIEVLIKIMPEAVINCAAYVRVDDAEVFPEKAFAVNALGARNISLICSDMKATLMYISTDYVFDGRKKSPYTEDELPNPLNVYGNSKLSGEYFVKNIVEKHYIVRSSSLFGVAGASGKGGNFVENMIKKARNGEEIKVVEDMIMSPTYTRDAAEILKNILEKKLPFGYYNLANDGQCSWFEFAEKIFEFINLDVNLSPTMSEVLRTRARRPLFTVLSCDKLREHGLKMERWDLALRSYFIEKGYLVS